MEEPVCTCGAVPGEGGTMVHQPECPLYEEPEAEPLPLTAPAITAAAYDEETGSMVLTVDGLWDSYAWESCSYGYWIPWEGDGASIVLEKGDFVNRGFRCTVTAGDQSVTSQVYAYDSTALEPPAMVPMAETGNLEETGEYMRYDRAFWNIYRFDIFGLDDGDDIRTTYDDSGYRTVIQVDGSSTKTEVRYREGPTSAANSLQAETNLSFAPGGRYVQVTYTVTNNGSTTQNFQIGTSADVMIGANDRARVSFTNNGLKMEGSWLGFDLLNAYNFYLVAPTCDTLWYGYYADAYENIFENRGNTDTYRNDSGMAWSWNGTVAPGETWERSVLIGAGEVPTWTGDQPRLAESHPVVLIPGEETTIYGTTEPGSEVHVSVGGEEYIATAGDDGTFTVGVTLPEDYTEEKVPVQIWAVGENGSVSGVTEDTIDVTPLPRIQLTTNSVTVLEDTELTDTWYRNFIDTANSNGTVTYVSEFDTGTAGRYIVTYTATVAELGHSYDESATLTVIVQDRPAELSAATAEATADETQYTLTATMKYTGGEEWTETGFVYGVIANPTLALCDGSVTTDPTVSQKNGTLTATVSASSLTYGISYYARAYARTADGTVIYGSQSNNFGPGAPQYGSFSVTSNNDGTFTITRTGGFDGEQTVYYRTVNGSAIGGTHFDHVANSVTFTGDMTSWEVRVTENSATAVYNDRAATAYANDDRVYFLEIYRVTGGATINENRDKAERTMTVDENYHVSESVYDEKHRIVGEGTDVWPDDNNYVGDRGVSGDHKIFFENDRGNNVSQGYKNFNVQRSVDVGSDLEIAYLKATAIGPNSGFLYRAQFTLAEDDDGYQHVWISNHAPNNLTAGPSYNGPIDLNAAGFGEAFYTARWETLSGDKGSGGLSLPSEEPSGQVVGVQSKSENGKIVEIGGNTYLLFSIGNTAHVWFSATGSGSDVWHMTSYQDWLQVLDMREPFPIGLAPMAGGVYEAGDEITIAVVFSEIVDEANSMAEGWGTGTTISTNWGTFHYEGGLNTNVLYFTGIVPENAPETIQVGRDRSYNINKVRDMCSIEGSSQPTYSGSITATIELAGEGNSPAITLSDIDNNNGTLSVTFSATNAEKLEYVWSDKATPEAVNSSWTLVAAGEAHTVTAARTQGTWYLHVRATSDAGVVVYESKSITLGGEGETVVVPTIEAEVNNNSPQWAKSRDIALKIESPSEVSVAVSGPGGISTTLDSNADTYTATAEGLYTFTITVDGMKYSDSVTVLNLDATAPMVAIQDLEATSYIEPVTLIVAVSDGQSGVAENGVTGTWSNGTGEPQSATLTPVEDQSGTYATTSPNVGGTWTLTVTATDGVGNTGTDTSSAYTLNLSAPTIVIGRPTKTNDGYVYEYTINAGDSDIESIQLPDGTILEGDAIPSDGKGSFTLTEKGIYYVTVSDSAGHVVTSDPIVITEEQAIDATAPEVRLSSDTDPDAWVKDYVTITVSVHEVGSTPTTFIWKAENGTEQTGNLTNTGEAGAYEGTFTVTENGTYTVTVKDSEGNEGTATIEIGNIDKDGPTITVTHGNPDDWTAGDVTVTFTVTDNLSGVSSVEVKDESGASVTVNPEEDNTYTFTATANDTYTITAKDSAGTLNKTTNPPTFTSAGNTSTQDVTISMIDKSQPSLEVTVTAGTNGDLIATVSADSSGDSPITVTVSKDNGTPDEVENGSYTIDGPGEYVFTAATGAGQKDTETVTVRQVKFESAYGTEPGAVLVQDGGKISAPAAPAQAGYAFQGWFQGSASTKFDFDTPITGNITLTAVWTLNAPAVVITGPFTGTYKEGETVVTLTADVEHDASGLNYTYQWYKVNNGEGEDTKVGTNSQTLPLATVAESGSYYVQVTAEDNKGLTSQPGTSDSVTVVISKAKPDAPAADTGYTIDFDAETIDIADGYEIFTSEDAATEITDGSITDYLGETIYIRTEENANHEPSGWTEIKIPARPAQPGNAVTVTDETVMNKNDGTATIPAGMEYIVVKPGEDAPDSEADWKNAPVGPANPKDLSVGTQIVVRVEATGTKPHGLEQTYTVNASETTLTVEFDSMGGSDVEDDTGIAYGGKAEEPTDPTRAGYAFDGWYKESTLATAWDFEEDTVTGNMTLYAKWTLDAPASVTVTGAPEESVTYDGTAVTLTVTPTHAAEEEETITYTYQWYKVNNGEGRDTEAGTGQTLSLVDVTDSGAYYVVVEASDGTLTSSGACESTPVSVTIAPKPIAVNWSGRTQVYDGTPKAITAAAAGLVEGDTCEVTLTYTDGDGNTVAAPTNAGSYTAQAVSQNANYTIFNATAALTIERAPVTFAVSENTAVYDGDSHAAQITPSDEALTLEIGYTVTYRDGAGDPVAAPAAVGTYTIWTEISNPNYRHAGAADGASRQIGTLTITWSEPYRYAVVFTVGQGAGSAPTMERQLPDSVLLLPEAEGLSLTGHTFAGWLWNGTVYQPGETFSMPAADVTFTAQWERTHSIRGEVVQTPQEGSTEQPAVGATVTLMLGGKAVSEPVTVDTDGTFAFAAVPNGLYNLVIRYEGIVVTCQVTVDGQDANCGAIQIPMGMTNSIVTVRDDTPVAVVGALDTVFASVSEEEDAVFTRADQDVVTSGGVVEVEFIASTPDADQQEEIAETFRASSQVSQNAQLSLFLDLQVQKTVTPVTGPESTGEIQDTEVLLETRIALPPELQGKDNYAVYRIHKNTDGTETVQALTTGGRAGEERIELNADRTVLTIYARYYSDYVLSWWDTPPSRPDSGPGGSSGGSTTYPPAVEDTDHGSVEVSPSRPSRGETVTITPTPDEGYAVDEVTVTDRNGDAVEVTPNGDGTWSFTQPAGTVTITVTFRPEKACPRDEACPIWPFTDASPSAWYHDGVHYCLEKGLMTGTGATVFQPNTAATRAMIAAMLYRLEGEPTADSGIDFQNVADAAWYAPAVRWAAAAGVVTGYGDGTFGPDDAITREQMAAMLYRYAQYTGYDVGIGEDTNILSYTDAFDISEYAIPAMQWACGAGLVTGLDGGRLDPGGTATRAQVATILMRFVENLAK